VSKARQDRARITSTRRHDLLLGFLGFWLLCPHPSGVLFFFFSFFFLFLFFGFSFFFVIFYLGRPSACYGRVWGEGQAGVRS